MVILLAMLLAGAFSSQSLPLRPPGVVLSVQPAGQVPPGSVVVVTAALKAHGHGHGGGD